MATPLRILIPNAQFAGPEDEERAAAPDGTTFDVFRESDPAVIPDAAWQRCDAMIVWHGMTIDRRVVDRLESCRIVVRAGIGCDNIDADACAERGIPVCNCPDYGTTDVADHALGMILALTRGLAFHDHALRQAPADAWQFDAAPLVRRLRGAVLGIVGLGRIGTAVARRAQALDMEVHFHDPYVPDGQELALGVSRCRSLEQLLEAADVVSLHAPLTAETREIIGANALAAMRDGTILVNTARGALVDVDAVHAALDSGRLGGAALDVLPDEPPDPGHPLVRAWSEREQSLAGRLLLTPHAAFYTREGMRDLRHKPVHTACAYLLDGRLANCVNRPQLAAHTGIDA